MRALFVLLGMSEATLLPFLPVYLLDRGFTATEIGASLAIIGLAAFVTSPLAGYAADRRLGSTRTLVLTAIGAAGAVLLFFLPLDDVVSTTLVALVVFVFRSPLIPLIDAIALEWLGPERRADYSGIRAWMSAGWAIGVLIWGVVLELSRIDVMPALYAIATLVIASYAALALDAGRRAAASPHAERRVWTPDRAGLPLALAGFLVSVFLLSAAFTATWNFLAVRIVDLGGGALLVAVAASVQAMGEIPAMAWIGRLSNVLSHRAIYVVGCAIYFCVFAAWGVLDDPVAIALLKLVLGVGFALTYVGAVVIVDDLVPERLRATGQSLSKAVSFALAPILGTLGGGWLYDQFGPSTMFVAATVSAAIAAAVGWLSISQPQTRPIEAEV